MTLHFRRIFQIAVTSLAAITVLIGDGLVAQEAPRARAVASSMVSSNKALGIGDIVTYRVLEDKDPPVRLTVTDTGDLDVPYLGRVRVVGKTTSQAKNVIKSKLEEDLYYTATVQLAIDQVGKSDGIIGKVYLSGNVNSPGPQDLLAGERATVGKVILRAGGLGEFADSRKVKIVRKANPGEQGREVIVDLKEVLERGRVDKDVEVYDGDMIIVPKRLINW